jgi:hypothetical protein
MNSEASARRSKHILGTGDRPNSCLEQIHTRAVAKQTPEFHRYVQGCAYVPEGTSR